MKSVEIFTDGGCEPNPGRGAWAAILRYGSAERELTGFEPETTNNRMEMTAAIMALEALKQPCVVTVYSDSEIVVRGSGNPDSIARRVKRAAQGKLPNADLWVRLDAAASVHSVSWVWVKGHNGHPENERCDELASLVLKMNR